MIVEYSTVIILALLAASVAGLIVAWYLDKTWHPNMATREIVRKVKGKVQRRPMTSEEHDAYTLWVNRNRQSS